MTTIKEAVIGYLAYIKGVRGFSFLSICAYKREVLKFVRFLGELQDVNLVTLSDLRNCVAYLSKNGSSCVSVNHFIVAVRSFFTYCKKFNMVDKNMATQLKTIKGTRKLVTFLTQTQLDILCIQPLKKEILWQSRDSALLEFFYSTGCRISEVANARLSQFCNNGKTLLVKGKGSKDRYVFLGNDAKKAIDAYLIDRNARFPECNDDSVFLNQRGVPLTIGGIRYILDRYTGSEGTGFHVKPHTLRHTFATAVLNEGADIRFVQELLGHACISTTQRYTHVTTADKIKAYNSAFPHAKFNIERSVMNEEQS